MRSVVLGLVATVAVAVLAPIAVMSAPKVAPPAVTEAARKQGMAEAPALAKAAGIGCQVADARFIGKVDNKKEKISTAFYEVDCAQGLGFVVQSINNGTKPSAFTCIEANTPLADGKPPTIPCLLPGNGDPKSDLAPLIAKSGTACVPELVRGIGQSVSSTFIEVACQGGAGLVLQAANPAEADKPVIANNCLDFDESGSNIKCTLHDKAYRLGVVDGLIKASNNGCTLKDRRYIGASTTGATFFEAACTDGTGYILGRQRGPGLDDRLRKGLASHGRLPVDRCPRSRNRTSGPLYQAGQVGELRLCRYQICALPLARQQGRGGNGLFKSPRRRSRGLWRAQ